MHLYKPIIIIVILAFILFIYLIYYSVNNNMDVDRSSGVLVLKQPPQLIGQVSWHHEEGEKATASYYALPVDTDNDGKADINVYHRVQSDTYPFDSISLYNEVKAGGHDLIVDFEPISFLEAINFLPFIYKVEKNGKVFEFRALHESR